MSLFSANHIICMDTIRGGLAVENPVLNEPGTVGFIGTSDGTDRWLVSCFHVLCRSLGTAMPPDARESVVYAFDGNQPARVLAVVDPTRADDDLDCAAALVVKPAEALGQILGVGTIHPEPIEAQVGMRVLKSGVATGVTEGFVRRLRVDGKPVMQIEKTSAGYAVCSRGDSGALWLDAQTLRPVALHTGGRADDERGVAVATEIKAVLARLGLRILSE